MDGAMKTVWKYPIGTGVSEHKMPIGAEVLCVQWQIDRPALWALVDTDAEYELRRFFIQATGEFLEYEPAVYVGTFQDRALVWHLFEQVRPERLTPSP
jgi:hypothetical protein